MQTYLFPPAPLPAIPVAGESRLYPLHRIFCVGKNYAAHAREMGGDPSREPPFYFSKPIQAMVMSGATIPFPLATRNCHYEMELVVALGGNAHRISEADAEKAIWGYACGLDMTRRDLQMDAKNKGLPWDVSKGFENSAVLSPLVPKAQVPAINQAGIRLRQNGVIKQQSHIGDMIWSIPAIISNLSQFFHLQAGDIIYTGTPAGVGAVAVGDVLHGDIDGVGDIHLTIGAEE